MLQRITLARIVNSVCGGAVVTPWDVYDLDDEWLDTFTSLYHEMR